MRIQIDRTLPVSLALQLQGQIEYGVTCGDFPPDSQLPSVRELAETLGVSPVTISQVYKTLQKKELIVTQPGRGTFVQTAKRLERATRNHSGRLERLIGQLLHEARTLGLEPAHLSQLLHTRLTRLSLAPPAVLICLVGVYPHVTRDYAAALARELAPDDEVLALTFTDLDACQGAVQGLQGADLVLTFAHRLKELRDRLGEDAPLRAIHLIPSTRTRVALAELDPLERVGLVSAVPEFLPTFKHAVRRFAPHLHVLEGAVMNAPEAQELAQTSDVIVYATGAESFAQSLPRRVKTFEYRHVPDPTFVHSAILSLVDEIRQEKQLREAAKEKP
jgi:DNA-binding transcriptional regulator YhcF (GntR family)